MKKGIIKKLYGGINMSWPVVLIMAVASAAVTAVFLIVPVFKDTSFRRMGEYLEAWIFLAVIIMSNCKKPLESAVKTFVFFLVSQPLIYLFQVPFSWQGWGLFGYYGYWFVLTLLTFPAAYVGWYITRRNWLSVLILAPVLASLGVYAADAAGRLVRNFPSLLVTFALCAGQIVVYIIAFFPEVPQKLAGALVAIAAAVAVQFMEPQVDLFSTMPAPDDLVLSENAEVIMGEGSAEVTIVSTGEGSMLGIRAKAFGGTDFTIVDGDAEYEYNVEIYEDEGGHSQIRFTRR